MQLPLQQVQKLWESSFKKQPESGNTHTHTRHGRALLLGSAKAESVLPHSLLQAINSTDIHKLIMQNTKLVVLSDAVVVLLGMEQVRTFTNLDFVKLAVAVAAAAPTPAPGTSTELTGGQQNVLEQLNK